MGDYTLAVNEFTNGLTGHVDFTLSDPNGVKYTFGLNNNNVNPSLGQQFSVVAESPPSSTTGTAGVPVVISQSGFNAVLSMAQSDISNPSAPDNSYWLAGHNCVDFTQHALDVAGIGTGSARNLHVADLIYDSHVGVYAYAMFEKGVLVTSPEVYSAIVATSEASAQTYSIAGQFLQNFLSTFLPNNPPPPDATGPEVVVEGHPDGSATVVGVTPSDTTSTGDHLVVPAGTTFDYAWSPGNLVGSLGYISDGAFHATDTYDYNSFSTEDASDFVNGYASAYESGSAWYGDGGGGVPYVHRAAVTSSHPYEHGTAVG